MKVYVLPADAYGCGHYRLIWPASVLFREGFDVRVIPPNEKTGFEAGVTKGRDGGDVITSLRIPADADLIVMQRPAHTLHPQMIAGLRGNGIAVVVDMDDDMSSIHRNNVAYATYHDRSDSAFSWKRTTESCKAATMVTTSTRRLQGVYAKHGRGRVLDNYVPEAYLRLDKPETGAFGWGGTTASHPEDLQAAGNSVRRLAEEGFEFRVVGGPSAVRQALRLPSEPHYTGNVGLESWARTIAQTIDVGMAPLAVSAFNSSKSRLKPIEMMSVGVPWVASPREEYRKLHRESGCGLLANTAKEWHANLRQLLTDPILRKEQAEMGRAYMQDQTYEANAWRWAEAWTDAVKLQRGA